MQKIYTTPGTPNVQRIYCLEENTNQLYEVTIDHERRLEILETLLTDFMRLIKDSL